MDTIAFVIDDCRSQRRYSYDCDLLADAHVTFLDIADTPFPGINWLIEVLFEISMGLRLGLKPSWDHCILKFVIFSNIARIFQVYTR